jgi:two-component system, OmpR family, phosphate regulon sensor histidine kinase PhoR
VETDRFRVSSLTVAFLALCVTLGLMLGLWVASYRHPFALGAMLAAGLALVALIQHRSTLARRSAAEAEAIERLGWEVERHRDALDDLADGLDVLVFLVDSDGAVQYANTRATEAFRFPDPVGQTLLAVTLSRELQDLVRRAAEDRSVQRAEIAFSHPTERIGVAQVWPESSGGGRLFVSVYDITDLRRLERVRRDFVANVSHELRTPMTTVRAMAETILEESPEADATTTRFLNKIVAEVDRLTHITGDLLTLSQAESDAPAKTETDLADIVRSVAGQLGKKAEDKGLRLTVQTPPTAKIRSNEAQLTQVAMNLLDNAINYTHSGTIDVALSEDGDWWSLEVEDTGIGIPSEHQSRIFERFYRVDKARSRASGGTGLGLAIVRHIVEAHGGTVAVKSELNQGSTFTVRLPKT